MTDTKSDAEAPRIVTLIASATEIVSALGMAPHLVGISHECDYPPEVLALPRLSAPKVDPELSSLDIDRGVREIVRDGLSVYSVDVAGLERLRPDVIVTQDHCEVCAVSLSDVEEALCSLDLPDTRVYSLHPGELGDVRTDMLTVATGLRIEQRGRDLVADFDGRLDAVRARSAQAVKEVRIALLEWLAPPMVAGGWMPELARIAGASPVIVESAHRFAEVTWPDVAAADPDLVVVLPCGFDVPRSILELEDPEVRAGMQSIRAVRDGKGYVLDGNAYFNRPGPRLADSVELLAAVVHPELFPDHVERYRSSIVQWP
jgi:iron complex transport system substrate-binding protein